jgi:hypothetical protein
MSLEQAVENPLRVVEALGRGELGASYIEPVLIVSGLIAGLSAVAWKGRGIDRQRYVEAWVRFAPQRVKVSVPLLCRALRKKGRVSEALQIEQRRPQMFGGGNHARVVTGDEVDDEEDELRRVCPTLTMEDLRLHSYPTVYYEQVRCGLVHEYGVGDHATDMPDTRRQDVGVSYANYSTLLPEQPKNLEEFPALARKRKIYFHIPWLIDLVRTIAANADRAMNQGPIERPASWWLPTTQKKEARVSSSSACLVIVPISGVCPA